ncbi:MAG TPA: methionyl-tRNA formyltransferase [Candidatus Paceibacterota bacterium]|nr:methionyl-tRNA formyltransferase [Candidatus Paceibacterota bacterium]HRZ34474.1 methionyl-tRNA formyltransferase [Candidatus Paceibacterota bacterium]
MKSIKTKTKLNFVFLGTDTFAVVVLEKLKLSGFTPKIIVTAPDKPSGRGQHLHQPPSKIWATKNGVKVLQPARLDSEFVNSLKREAWDFFIVASYGKIIPDGVLALPQLGSLNVHPSLLPKFRGASPIESAMLADEKETGVTIMLVDAEMDHGPILTSKKVSFKEWPPRIEVEKELATIGGELLAEIIPKFAEGKVSPIAQNHDKATFTKKINKEDGEISLNLNGGETALNEKDSAAQYSNFLKIQALNPWPGVYFFIEHKGKKIRVKITSAKFQNGKLEIEKVIPEGKKEMSYADFKRGFIQN